MYSTSRVSLFPCLQPSRADLPERPEKPPVPVTSIPFCRDPNFVERGDLPRPNRTHLCSRRPPYRVALVGLGGVGKSELAVEYARRISEAPARPPWIFWVHAGTQARVEEGLRLIADAAKLAGRNQSKADILQLVYKWLSNERSGRWIIVLDSADDQRRILQGDRRRAR